MFTDFLLEVFKENISSDAIVWRDTVYDYQWLLDRISYWNKSLQSDRIEGGKVVIIEADFSPNVIALLLSLIEKRCIIVPLTSVAGSRISEFIEIALGEVCINIDSSDNVKIYELSNQAEHDIYDQLRSTGHPGLVLFSSGSAGPNKAAVHDFSRLLKKFEIRRHNLRTLTFLLFDHVGGIDTLFYSLSNGSCIITVNDRSPDVVCAAVEKYGVEVLPVSPTFINLLILSEAYKTHDLSSLKYVTYGTEVMPQATLAKCAHIIPQATILQKYGTTEIGTLRSKSKSSDSLWVKVGGEGFETRVVNGVLHVKAKSAMLGYLNAPSPFTEDGWFDTGDLVEVDGDYIRFLGRKSEVINVGGEKVYPAEVESVIQELDNVAEVVVSGEQNPIVGNIVCAKVTLLRDEDHKQFKARLKKYCRQKLQSYKVPVKVEIVEEKQHSGRFKKLRHSE
jgi:long-chain acyl-CoA synthetase